MIITAEEDVMDDLTDSPLDGGPTTRSERRLVESAGEHLGDEQVRTVVRGQTVVSPIILPLVGPWLFLFNVRQRAIIITERSVITVQESIWFQSKVARLVSRYGSGAVSIHVTRFGLKVGDDRKIFATLRSFPAMKHLALLGSPVGA